MCFSIGIPKTVSVFRLSLFYGIRCRNIKANYGSFSFVNLATRCKINYRVYGKMVCKFPASLLAGCHDGELCLVSY